MKHLKYIFISIFAVLLMSHNTYADVLSIGVSPKWTNWAATWSYNATCLPGNNCLSNSFTWGTSSANTYVADPSGVSRVKQRK